MLLYPWPPSRSSEVRPSIKQRSANLAGFGSGTGRYVCAPNLPALKFWRVFGACWRAGVTPGRAVTGLGGAKPDLISQQGSSGRKSVLADSVGSSRCWGRVSLLLLFPLGLCIVVCFLQGGGGLGLLAGWGAAFSSCLGLWLHEALGWKG